MSNLHLEVTDADTIDPSTWNALISHLNGPFVQSHAWSRCISHLSGGDCKYMIIRKQDIPAAAGWCRLSSGRIGPLVVSTSIDMESLPCYDPSRINADEVFRMVLSLAEKYKAGEVRFGNSPVEFLPNLPEKEAVEKISFTLDLGLPRETLFASLSDTARRKLRKAERQGIVVTRVRRGDDPAQGLVRPLFEHTIAKHISAGKRRDQNDKDFFLKAIRELLGCGSAVLYMAFQGSEPLSCYLLSTFDRHALYLFGGSSPEGYRLNASYPVMWAAITELQDQGFRSFSLGEVRAAARDQSDADHGLYRFKKEFGGRETRLCSGVLVTRPLQQACLSLAVNMKHAVFGRSPLVKE